MAVLTERAKYVSEKDTVLMGQLGETLRRLNGQRAEAKAPPRSRPIPTRAELLALLASAASVMEGQRQFIGGPYRRGLVARIRGVIAAERSR